MIEILILIYVCSMVIAFIDIVHWYLDLHGGSKFSFFHWVLIASFVVTPLMNTVAALISIKRLVKNER